MQKQTITANITIENNPIKMLVIVLSLSILSLLFMIVSSIMLVHSSIILPINLFLQIQNIDLVYTKYHVDIRKYLDSTCILWYNLLC